MPAVSTCLAPSCRTQVVGSITACPTCGGRMRTPRSVRVAGYILSFCGLFLVVMTGWLTTALFPSMSHPGVQVGGTIFSGTAEQARAILSLFGAVGAFGIGAIVYGSWMIVTGRRSVAMTLGVLALALVLAGTCWWTLTKLPA